MIVLLAEGDALVRHLLLDVLIKGAIVLVAISVVVLGAVLIVRHLGR